MAGNRGWYGVDLDGTLAHYDGWKGAGVIGAPIPAMVERVKGWLKSGRNVKIFTARVYTDGTLEGYDKADAEAEAIRQWCLKHIGQVLEVTNYKDFSMIELWDDRAVQVVPNTGVPVDGRGMTVVHHNV